MSSIAARKVQGILLMLFLATFNACNTKTSADYSEVNNYLSGYQKNKSQSQQAFFSYVKMADSVLSKIDNPISKATNNYLKGAYFISVSNNELALKFLNEVEVNLQKTSGFDSLLIASYLNICHVYTNFGNFDESLKIALKAKVLAEKNKDSIGFFGANYGIARMYQTKGDIDKAKQVLKQNAQINNDHWRLRSQHLLANIYGELGEIDSALQIDNRMIAEFKDKNMSDELSPFYNNKALCLNEKKLFDSSMMYFKASYDLDSISGNIRNMAVNYIDMAGMLVNRNEFATAISYAEKARELIKGKGLKPWEISALKVKYNVSTKTGNYQQALSINDSIKKIQKEVDNIKLTTSIEELNLVYETSKKEKTIQEQQNTILKKNLSILGAVILLLGAGLFVWNFKRKQKLQNELERISLQQEKEKAIQTAEETERQRISKDLHDNMGAYTSALLANVDKLKRSNAAEPELKNMKENAEQILASLRETIWVLNNKEISVQELYENFSNYCFKILRNFEHINFESVNKAEQSFILPAPAAIHINKILQECFQNSIKHSQCTQLRFTISGNLTFSLADNGIGFVESEVNKGYGLENLHWRAAQIQSIFQIESLPNNGTTATLIYKA
jgi:signal transduction histidine kinase